MESDVMRRKFKQNYLVRSRVNDCYLKPWKPILSISWRENVLFGKMMMIPDLFR